MSSEGMWQNLAEAPVHLQQNFKSIPWDTEDTEDTFHISIAEAAAQSWFGLLWW